MERSKSQVSIHNTHSQGRLSPFANENLYNGLRRVSSDVTGQIDKSAESNGHVNQRNGASVATRSPNNEKAKNVDKFEIKNGYKLTYDPEREGGNEYKVEKPDGMKSVLSKIWTAPYTNFTKTPNVKHDGTRSVSDNDFDKSRTFITDDTSLPIFDDVSSINTYVVDFKRDDTPVPEDKLGGTYTVKKSKVEKVDPVSPTLTYTVDAYKLRNANTHKPGMLTPDDRNEPHLAYANRRHGQLATVKHVSKTTVKPESKLKVPKKVEVTLDDIAKKTQETKDPGDTLNSVRSSIPPPNFKANLFNRVKKLSTPRRLPKFSPLPQSEKSTHVPVSSKSTNKPTNNTQLKKKSGPDVGVRKVKEAFMTEVQDKRFERLNSSQSVRNHYDPKIRKPENDVGVSKSAKKRTGSDRYEDVNLKQPMMDLKPKRHRRSIGVSKTETKLPVFTAPMSHQKSASRSQLPVAQSTPTANSSKAGFNKVRVENHKIKDTSRDVFSENDKKMRLRQAQYITDDLKIVKTKLQDSDFVAQHIDSKILTTLQKESELANMSKSTLNVRDRHPLNPLKSFPASAHNLGAPNVVNKKSKDTSNDVNVKDAGKLSVNVKSSQNANLKSNIWRVLPKIHRIDRNKQRNPFQTASRSSVMSNDTYRNNSVAKWVLKSAKTTERITEVPIVNFSQVKSQPNKLRKSISRHKLDMQNQMKRNKAKSSSTNDARKLSFDSSKENLINSGMYMPLGIKKLKRKPKRLKPKLYTQVGKTKGYESEIPVLYSDEDDTGPEPRPFTDTMRNRNPYYPSYRRYEGENDHVRINFRDPAHKKIGRSSGALVRFFRNGDPNDKGLPLTVNRKFLNFEALLVFLNDKIPTPTGVKYVFKWPEGTEVKSITDFRNRCVYVVASRNKLNRDVTYGESAESFWCNRKPSAGLRKNEVDLFKRPRSPKDSPTRNSPLVVTIINNTSRDKREKVILNPNTQQTFEEWLEDITNPDIPIKGIFSDKPPYQEVKSFSQLFRELKINSNFLACGDEMVPVEVAQKRQAPSSNSSTDSVNESRGKKKKVAKQNEMGQIYENGRPESPTSTSMSRYDTGPKYPPYGTRGRLESRRNTKDRVEIEIDGAIREFYPPTYIDPEDDGMKPNKTLRCEWVYGFKGRDAHDNMLVLPSGELVYYVAAVVVLFDKDKDIQRHYIKHNEEVTCMSLHPYRNLIATGQLHGKEPEHASHIRIWDTGSLSTYSVIGLGVFFGGIISIGFCKDGIGNFMCVLDGSEKHVLSVWEWQTERVVARTTTSSDAVHCACFYPDGANNSLLITYGAKHIFFWKIFYDIARKKEAKILRDRQSGIFELQKDEVPKSVNCLTFLPTGDVISGDSSGNLMVWDRDSSDAFTCKFVVNAHNGTIMAMCLLDDGTLLTTSGSEIKAWDTESNFRPVKTRTIPQEAGKIRSLITQTPGGVDGRIYVGTNNGAILDGSLQLKFRYLVQGHSDGIRGVFPHPFEPTFVSAGLDQVVYKWSLVNHKVIWRAHVEAPCTALAIDYRQELIAIGTSDGIFIVLNSYNGMHIATVEVGTESVCCLAFSPDGSLLALGCNDGLISVYAIHDRGQTYRKFNMALKGHNSGVSNIDWSKDGRCLQSVSVDHELLFWDIDSMQMIKIPRMMRDVDWFTHTCHVAYYLLGPWTNMEKNETVKVVNRSNYRDLLVTGDSRGRVRLYKYPCSKERAEFRSAQIYSSDVTAVCFTPHNSHVLSCGGKDSALVQWQISEDQ
ncbi:Echinoderm microtubule-associated protein-like 1 [Mactra antiquata]